MRKYNKNPSVKLCENTKPWISSVYTEWVSGGSFGTRKWKPHITKRDCENPAHQWQESALQGVILKEVLRLQLSPSDKWWQWEGKGF